MYHDLNLVIRVLQEFYVHDYNQSEISDIEHISKSTISRILKMAKEEGLVSFNLNLPIPSLYDLEEQMKNTFKIKHVSIVPNSVSDVDSRYMDVAKKLAVDINKIIQDGDAIGLCWGRGMNILSNNLIPCVPIKHNLKIVQISGSLAQRIGSSVSYNIVENFSENYLCNGYILPAPAIVDSIELKDLLIADTQIKEVLNIGERARIAIFGIGIMSSESTVFKTGTVSLSYYDHLKRKGAVSDILTHFLDIEGNIADVELDKRTVCLSLESLKRKEYRIAFAAGDYKAKAIISGLNSGVINSFYTDELTARKVIEEYKKIFG